MKNFAGEKAYYACVGCGLELLGDEVGDVAAGDNYANGEFAPCPKCGVLNSIDRDDEES